MKLKLFILDTKGYMETRLDVSRIIINKLDGKNVLEIRYTTNDKEPEIIPLKEIAQAFMIDLNTMDEMFRYEK